MYAEPTTPPLSRAESLRQDPRAERVLVAYQERFGRPPEVLVRSPGRVVLLGAHIDYQEAKVLPAAIDRAVFLAAGRGTDDHRVRLLALDLEAAAELESRDLPPPVAEREGHRNSFADYPAGVVRELLAAGLPIGGLDAVYGGDLPQGAGVSSSAAVEVAFLLAYEKLFALGASREHMARLARRAENLYLGVLSGPMDQLACLHGRAGHALLIDCRSFTVEALPLPDDLRLVVFDSGVRRRLVDSAFNDRRAECRRAIELLRPEVPGLEVLRDLDLATFQRLRERLPAPLDRRVRHALEEMARVEEGAVALREGDAEHLGLLMRRSQASSRDLYEVSLPELDLLCSEAWDVPGCLGARLMGGGFGGAVAALVRVEAATRLERQVVDHFEEAFGRRPAVFKTGIADGAAAELL